MKPRLSKTLFYFIVFMLSSCSQPKSKDTDSIHIEINKIKKYDIQEIFQKIEIIPLETSKNILLGKLNRIIHIKNKYYIYVEHNMTITIFDNAGRFISNSSNVIGSGPKEYFTMISLAYNDSTGNIEILTAKKQIIKYDIHFNYKEKITIKSPIFLYHNFYPLNNGRYLLFPSCFSKEYNQIHLYDSKKKTILKKTTVDHIYSKFTKTDMPIRFENNKYYFSPIGTTYYGYEINVEDLTLTPILKFDFGKSNISTSTLDQYTSDREKADFLFGQLSYPIPLKSTFNDSIILSEVRYRKKYATLVFNKQNNNYILIDAPFKNNIKKPHYFMFDKNVFYACIQPYYIKECIDMKLLDKKGLAILKNLKDDDNPVILKFHLNFQNVTKSNEPEF